MPRGRGGAREGKPGASYSNRTDLNQPVRTAPSQTYGDAAASAKAQQAVPLPQQPAPFIPQPLHAPSARPDEPLTAGMASGPGAGPDMTAPAMDPVLETLRAAYRAMPNESVAALIEAIENRQ